MDPGGGRMTGISVIGAGVIGRVHAENIASSESCRLIHVADLDQPKAERLADRLGAANRETAVGAVLGDERVEAVVIVSSTAAHEEHVLAAAAAGKAILVEKPVSDSLERARACLSAVRESGVVAAVGFNRRFDPNHRALFEQVRRGRIGRVETLHLTSRSESAPDPRQAPFSGGMLREKGSHFYDLACWIAGSEPRSVFAAGDCLFEPAFREYGDLDTAVVPLRMNSRAIASFSFSGRSGYGYDERIEVHGSRGMMESRRPRRRAISIFQGDTISDGGLHRGWYERFEPTYRQELEAFVRALRGEQDPHASIVDGVRAQAIAEAAVQSALEGQPVRVPEVAA